MKKIVMLALFSVSAVAFAAQQKSGQGILEYKVTSAKYAKGHVLNPQDGMLTLDYTNQKVRLVVTEKTICAKGMMCAQMIKTLTVDLPITGVETDNCGIRHVVAAQDQRPVDGIMQKLTVSDPSDMTCKTFVAVTPNASYESAYVNRKDGKSVQEISTMELALNNAIAADSKILLKYKMSVGFSPDPSVMTLTVDNKGKVLSVVERMRSQKTTRMEIAQLSNAVVENLKKQLATVPSETKLVDDREGEPVCSDALVATIVASVKGQEVQIYESSGCHISKSYDGEAASLANAVIGLTYLAK